MKRATHSPSDPIMPATASASTSAQASANAEKITIHWFEHSSFGVKDAAGTLALIDPYFPKTRPPSRFIRQQPPLRPSQLPIDFVLLTHSHTDHTHCKTLRRIARAWPTARFIGPFESINAILKNTSIPASSLLTIEAGDSIQCRTLVVHAVYAKLPTGDPKEGIPSPQITHLGYVVESGGIAIYFSGDPIRTFASHQELVHAVAAHQPQVGVLTTHPAEGEFPDFTGCAEMAARIGLTHVIPSHYDCFVHRTYDPYEWARHFPPDGPRPIIIPHNSHIQYPL